MKQSPVKKPVHKGKKAEPKAGKNLKKFGMYWGLDWLIILSYIMWLMILYFPLFFFNEILQI